LTTDTFKKLSRKDLRQLKPGAWVAWHRHNVADPGLTPALYWQEGQVIDSPIRCFHDVIIRFNGICRLVPKNRLYKVMPVIGVEAMHTEYDYNS
jgi:hypothetical protein